jgi:RecA-family ATPase
MVSKGRLQDRTAKEPKNLSKKTKQWLKYVAGNGGETSQQLMDADIPVPEAVVENFLNRGEMMILALSPKVGKSLIAAQLAIAVACDGKFLSEFQAQRGTVLWDDVDDRDQLGTAWRLDRVRHRTFRC